MKFGLKHFALLVTVLTNVAWAGELEKECQEQYKRAAPVEYARFTKVFNGVCTCMDGLIKNKKLKELTLEDRQLIYQKCIVPAADELVKEMNNE